MGGSIDIMEGNKSKFTAVLLLLFISCTFCIMGCEKNKTNEEVMNNTRLVEEKFNYYYGQWREYIKKPPGVYSSSRTSLVKCESFQNIIKLGKPALPLLIKKIEDGKAISWGESQYVLWYAIKEITDVNLVSEEDDIGISEIEIADRYLDWWKNKQTKNN